MKKYRSSMVVLWVVFISFTTFAGCSGDTKAPTPQQKEEQRQKLLKRDELQRREAKKSSSP